MLDREHRCEIARCCIIDGKLRGCELNDIADELDAEAARIGAEGNGPPIPMPPVS